MQKALSIFIKNPIEGRVKTRLARTVGDAKALEIYEKLLKLTRQQAEQLQDVKVYVFYSDFVDWTDEWSSDFFEKRVQLGNDLGERMYQAFQEVFRQHQQVCIIGSDCPDLSVEILQQAFTALESNDFVIGPSTDGGYYLLGMSGTADGFSEGRIPAYLFEEIPWSTESVFSETRARIRQHKNSLVILPALTDVDEEADWLLYQNTTPSAYR